jgi:hypothetical protein
MKQLEESGSYVQHYGTEHYGLMQFAISSTTVTLHGSAVMLKDASTLT